MIYDVGFLRHPRIYSSGPSIGLTTKYACRVSDAVFSLSAFTSDELTGMGLLANPITLPIHALRRYQRRSADATPYALTVGTQQRHKNLGRLVAAWDRRPRGNWKLILCGAAGSGTEALTAAVRSAVRPEAIVLRGYVPELEIASLEAHAALHINPSLYEGLGIPVMNALCSGVPVISASSGSPGRVLDGCPQFLFDPYSVESMDALITRALEDVGFRNASARAGPALVSLTAWPAVGTKIIDGLKRSGSLG
jgi:glycosyltransferase involved in cell wall biosynthesis